MYAQPHSSRACIFQYTLFTVRNIFHIGSRQLIVQVNCLATLISEVVSRKINCQGKLIIFYCKYMNRISYMRYNIHSWQNQTNAQRTIKKRRGVLIVWKCETMVKYMYMSKEHTLNRSVTNATLGLNPFILGAYNLTPVPSSP